MKKGVAIRVDRVSKDFRFSSSRTNTLKSLLTGLFRKTSEKEIVYQALRDLSFEIKEGEFFGIVGRNGSGKSTLLKILAGIYQPTTGKVDVRGRLVPFIELGVGFNPELSGKENVFLNGALLGFSDNEVKRFYSEVVEFAELEKFMDQKLKNYSSGMQVRLAFSMAIRAKADILLIDEVLAVGDMDFQKKCFDYFKTLKQQGQTVVFVSHDMSAVQQYCDRVLLIDNSKMVKIDDADTVSTMYSKLFTPFEPGSTNKSLSGEERWGDGSATWRSVTAKPVWKVTPKGQKSTTIKIVAKGVAHKTVDYPIFGFSIKDSAFNQISGMNTMRQGVKVERLAEGEEFTVEWKVPNIFNEGLYYVDCTIAQDQATMVCDRWPEAADFIIERSDQNPYKTYLDAKFNFKKY